MKIQIKKTKEDGIIPTYAHNTDAGLDLTATSKEIVSEKEFGFIEYGTSLAIQIPKEFVGFICPRSSISKTGMILANSIGVIDSGYIGEIKCRFKWIPVTKQYEVGERVAQLIILPYPTIEWEETNELSQSAREDKAWGSSGN